MGGEFSTWLSASGPVPAAKGSAMRTNASSPATSTAANPGSKAARIQCADMTLPFFRRQEQAQPLPAGLQAQAGPHAQRLCFSGGVAADKAAWQPHWQPAPGQFVQLQGSFIWTFMVGSFLELVSYGRTEMSDTRSVFARVAADLNETADLGRCGPRVRQWRDKSTLTRLSISR